MISQAKNMILIHVESSNNIIKRLKSSLKNILFVVYNPLKK